MKLNGGVTATAVGIVVAALLAIFSLFGSVPWASKNEFAEHKSSIDARLQRIESDVRDVRNYLMPSRESRR